MRTTQKDESGTDKDGFAHDSPQTGTPATDLDDDCFDMSQEELRDVVEVFDASLEKGRHDRLLTALRALPLSRRNPSGDIKSDDMVGTAFGNLGLGEATKRNVDIGDNQVSDMGTFASDSGWLRPPGGHIVQFGISPGNTIRSIGRYFPISFPNQPMVSTSVTSDAVRLDPSNPTP